MQLPVMPPVAPMLAKLGTEIPSGDGWLYEPKWDGFRCIAFRDGMDVELASRNERPLTRYFPEVADALRDAAAQRCVLDGEIILVGDRGLDFETLQLRLHPADSRVRMLAQKTPAAYVAFDVLALGEDDLRGAPLSTRRELLDSSKALPGASPSVFRSPATTDAAVAAEWFTVFEGAGLDGVVAKRLDGPYRENERLWTKVKHARTADCVVAGFRRHKQSGIGSLLLGLYDSAGVLRHVGIAASFAAKRRLELTSELEPLREGAWDDHPWKWEGKSEDATPGSDRGRTPGGPSRWTQGKDLSWEALRPERVCEVAYDYMQGDRFRHATRFVRWRPDREPASCTYDQIEQPAPFDLAALLGPA